MEKLKLTFEYNETSHQLFGKQTVVTATVEDLAGRKYAVTKEFGYVDYACKSWVETLTLFFQQLEPK